MAKTAIVLGASGATGSQLLKLLINDANYSTVKLFNRSPIGTTNPKVKEYVINLFELEKHRDEFTGDEVFCCIGTTKAKTPDEATYHKIDYGIPVTAAKLAKENNIDAFIVISALGADKNSRIFYSRTKGEMEEAVKSCAIAKTHILRPSLIVAERRDKRIMEKVVAAAMRLINPLLLGKVAKYKSIKAENIAKAMLWLANHVYPETVVQSDEITKLAALYRP